MAMHIVTGCDVGQGASLLPVSQTRWVDVRSRLYEAGKSGPAPIEGVAARCLNKNTTRFRHRLYRRRGIGEEPLLSQGETELLLVSGRNPGWKDLVAQMVMSRKERDLFKPRIPPVSNAKPDRRNRDIEMTVVRNANQESYLDQFPVGEFACCTYSQGELHSVAPPAKLVAEDTEDGADRPHERPPNSQQRC